MINEQDIIERLQGELEIDKEWNIINGVEKAAKAILDEIKENYYVIPKASKCYEGHIYYFHELVDIGVGNMEHLGFGFNGLTQEIAKENESCPARLFIMDGR